MFCTIIPEQVFNLLHKFTPLTFYIFACFSTSTCTLHHCWPFHAAYNISMSSCHFCSRWFQSTLLPVDPFRGFHLTNLIRVFFAAVWSCAVLEWHQFLSFFFLSFGSEPRLDYFCNFLLWKTSTLQIKLWIYFRCLHWHDVNCRGLP